MPITIKNSAGGGVTLDSTTSSNETLQLPSGGGTLAPLASPSFTGTVTANTSGDSNSSKGLVINTTGTNFESDAGIIQVTHAGGGATTGGYFMKMKAGGGDKFTIKGNGDVTATGSVGIGTTVEPQNGTAGVQIRPAGSIRMGSASATGHNMIEFNNPNGFVGGIVTNGSATSFNTSSDYRLKENVTPMSGATAQTKLLKPCNFDWIAGGNVNGFLAHELAEVVPEAVSGTKDAMMDEEYEVTPAVVDDEGNETTAAVMGTRSVPDMQGIDQSKLVPLLTATIQELIARIEALENV
jgi:hypothetical protein